MGRACFSSKIDLAPESRIKNDDSFETVGPGGEFLCFQVPRLLMQEDSRFRARLWKVLSQNKI